MTGLVVLGAVLLVLAAIAVHDRLQKSAHDRLELPGPRTLPLLVRGARRAAPAVHRHGERRGAPLQPRPAPLDLRVGEEGEQLLRVRDRQRPREGDGLRRRPSLRVPAPLASVPGEEEYDPGHPCPPRRSSAGRADAATRSGRRASSNTSAMSYGSLSHAAVEAINRGVALAGAMQNTGEGASPTSTGRAGTSSGRSAPATSAAGTRTAASRWSASSRTSRARRCAPSRSSSRRGPSRGSAASFRPRR